jgi:type IV secretory pathway TraG/TraD family ATPase VirD4
MAGMIYKSAGPQRGGMFGSLSMVADSLKLLPTPEEGKGRWTATEWARRRRGWIFVTSTPEVREQLRPFVSMWLDMLILRLMNQGRPGSRRVWFLLDEVQTLHRLPQLDTALFETRKSDDALFLFFQGRSQMQAIYGEKCQAMLSALKTKLFLATTEPEAAQWISDTIGNVEWERLEETRHDSQMPPHKVTYSYRVVNEKTPLVSRETFTGMRPGHAYLKFQNLVVKISFPYIGRPETQPGFILRESAMMMPQRKPPATDDGEASATSGGHEIWR